MRTNLFSGEIENKGEREKKERRGGGDERRMEGEGRN